MGFLDPGALIFFALIPLLALAYLVKERPRTVTVSSVIGFYALRGLRSERPWGWPRFDWLFLIELLILSLAVLAMASPYLIRKHTPVAVVMDNSAVMQVREPAGTRLQQERERLLAALPAGNDVAVSLFFTAPAPHPAATAVTVAQARTAIEQAAATDAPDDGAAVARLLSGLNASRRFAQILYAGVRPLGAPLPADVRTLTVGAPAPNFALGSFIVSGGQGFGAQRLQAQVSVANFSPAERNLQVELFGDDKPIAHASVHLVSREVGSVTFPALERAAVYRAQLSPADAFALDNVAYATSAAGESLHLLFVSPTPADAQGLAGLPGISVQTVAPQDYSPANSKADLIVFEYAVPKELPGANALLVMPPPGDPVFDLRDVGGATTQITSWRTPDPLTDGVNFRLLALRQAQSFAPHTWLAPVVTSNLGGLILAGSHEGHRYVAMGINPFPYLGSRNLPMSILTLNILGYLSGFGAVEQGYRTGRPWVVPAGITSITAPGGATFTVKPGALFSGDGRQGIYRLTGAGGAVRLRAVNLDDFTASDLEEEPPLKVDWTASGAPVPDFSEHVTLTSWLLAALLALAACEALVIYRRRRGGLQLAS